MLEIEFDWENLDKRLQRIAETLEDELDKIAGQTAERIRAEAIENLDKNGTNNTGDLRKSIVTKGIAPGVWLVEVGEYYGVFVEYGTKPRKRLPPVDEIEKWVVRKLGIKGKDARKVAFAVAKAIKDHGTKAQPFFRPAVKKGETEFKRSIESLLRSLVR